MNGSSYWKSIYKTTIALSQTSLSVNRVSQSMDGQPLYTAAFWRTATVVWNRSYVADRSDFKACSLQCADCRFTACTRSFNRYFKSLHAVLHRCACSCFCSHLGSERRGLTGALESECTCARPGYCVTLCVRDRDDCVVESGTDVCDAGLNILFDAAFTRLLSTCHSVKLPPLLIISSCLRLSCAGPCGYVRYSSCADRVQEGRGGGGYHGCCRFPSDA